MYMCFTIALIAYCIATPFFNLLAESYNVAEVYSGYYIWLLSYGLPLAIGVVCPGTHYTTQNYFSIVFATAMAGLGVTMITYYQDDEEDMPVVQKTPVPRIEPKKEAVAASVDKQKDQNCV